jgi:hypothetical protein
MGVGLPSPHIVKTQLSSNPGNGEAMVRKRAEAPKLKNMTMMMIMMMKRTDETEGLTHV